MKFVKFDRQLQLMLLLTQNSEYTVEQVSQKLNMSKRSIYRYLESYRDMGFTIVKKGSIYRLDKESPFFEKISSKIHFTEDEAMTIAQLLFSVHDTSGQIRALRNKLSNLYDYKVLRDHDVNEMLARNINTLYEAIKQERTVVLHNYHSPSSNTTTDRIIEPYLFLSANSEVRGYELKSQKNKTFKISRIEYVEMLDLYWTNKSSHKALYYDLFHFSGEKTYPLQLRLSQLATTVLIEEVPESVHELELQKDGSSLLNTKVCSFKGIGRFVMGLSNDIEILKGDEFRNYLKEKTKDLTLKYGE